MLSKLVRLALPVVVALALPWSAAAQPAKAPTQPVSSPAAADTSQQAYRPPVIQFDPKGLSLLDAVMLTLQHDPNIRLRDTDLQQQAGVLREQRGTFDITLKGNGNYQYNRSELTDTDKFNQKFKRDQLDLGIAQGKALVASLNQAVINLTNPTLATNPKAVGDLSAGVTDPDVALELQTIKSELDILQDTLNRVTDTPTRNDLTNLRNNTLTQAQQRFNTARQGAVDGLNQAITLRTNLGTTPQDQWSKNGDVRLDFTRPTRSGIILDPYLSLNYSDANFVGKTSFDPQFGGEGIKPEYKTELGFDLTLPLLRTRGKDDTDASEMAAQRSLEAARYDLLHEKATSVLNTVLAYWDARAAAEQVDVAQRSVDIETQMADLITRLVAAQEKARTDQTRVNASLADAQGRLEGARRALSEARVTLARVMGVAVGDAQSIPLAGDPFPRPGTFTTEPAALAELTRQALAARGDQQSALKSEEAGKILERGAQLEARRQLDLKLAGWGNSTEEDTPRFGHWVFRSGSVGLDLEVPFSNNAALGRHDQAVAKLHQSTINQTDLGRTIALNVYRAAESVRLAAERVKWAEEAALAYEKTIQDEQARLRSGDSTLVDTILTEQQTTSARIAFVQALQDYAGLVARLRFESGTLIRDVNGQTSVPLENLLTVPLPLQKGPAR